MTFDLVVYVETIVKGFYKYHKYTIGEDLRNYSKELLFMIQRANMSSQREAEIFPCSTTLVVECLLEFKNKKLKRVII